MGSRGTLNPHTSTSPSGVYSLYIKPGDEFGEGKATYRLTRKGKVVWEGVHPFTLWEAQVSDDGTVGGYAYPRTRKAGSLGEDDFAVVILDPAGKVRLDQRVKRKGSRFPDASDNPLATGVLMDAPNDRFIVRIEDEDINRQQETWWVYELSTGRALKRVIPNGATNRPLRTLLKAKLVVGTPLVLVHWWRYDDYTGSVGTRFALIDPSGKPVWSLELPCDYTLPDNEQAEQRLRNDIRKNGAILSTDKPRHFALRLVAKKQRVTFVVTKNKSGKWLVKEVGRVPYLSSPKDI